MDNNLLQIKVRQRLNKLASFDYDNIKCWQIVEAFNKAQIQWIRNQVQGNMQAKDASESSVFNIDDLQVIITKTPLAVTKQPGFFETELIPSSYLFFKRLSAKTLSSCCSTPRPILIYLAQVGDVDELMADEFSEPSAEWGETFSTLQGNKLKIYTADKFDIIDVQLHYYRHPRNISIAGCADPSTGNILTDVQAEFKDDIMELIIDETCSILSGDTELFNQYQRLTTEAKENN